MKKVHRKGPFSVPVYMALFVILVAMIILTVLRLGSGMTDTPNITISKPVALLALSSTSDTNDTSVELTEPNKAMATDDPAQLIPVSTPEPQTHTVDYKVKSGDSLESIFKHFSLPIQTLFGILEADEPYLEMDVLHPGQQLGFTFNNDDTLMALSVVSSTKKTIVYQKEDDNHFSHNETIAPTTWETVVLKGEISNSFYLAAANAGISDPTIMMLTKLIRNKINFRRDLRKNDQFQVIIKREMLDDTPVGNNYVAAIRLAGQKIDFNAYLHTDGQYYDKDGHNLTPALLRYPTRNTFRISSPFNPKRHHSITGKISPHNGVDFAMPIGTPIISTGDGQVERVANHRYAGKYLVIKEFGPYSTRYLHLSKILVHRGQKISRGQIIAYSGNTGRSTGPHLHYELRINDKPVNPITAEIPTLKSVSETELAAFHEHVKTLDGMMSDETTIATANLDWLNNWLINTASASTRSMM